MRQGCKQIKLKESTIIMCGGEPTDHKCNDDLAVYLLKNGERVEMTDENFEKYKEEIVGGSVVCSICGRAAIDNALWI